MTELRAAAADGTELAVTVSGGGPPLLMIPGLGASRRVYAPLLPLLAARLRVVVFDPRGTGGSGVTPGPYTMAQLAGDAAAVLDAAGLETAAVWGASMGGMVAQHLALLHPARVDRLLLACTSCGGPHAVAPTAGATAALLGRGARTPAGAYRLACTVLYAEGWQAAHPDVIDAEVAERGRHPVRGGVFAAQQAAVRGHDTFDSLSRITAPTLVLHGTDDAVVPVENGRILAARIPGARLVLLPGRGHLFFHESPEQSAAAVLGFLEGPG
ncbi:MAG TPA: alpha/beta fold hydrolase [Candidatus Dormibacteraeota bacterium]